MAKIVKLVILKAANPIPYIAPQMKPENAARKKPKVAVIVVVFKLADHSLCLKNRQILKEDSGTRRIN